MFRLPPRDLARLATSVENGAPVPLELTSGDGLILGVTGPPGAGKSTLVDGIATELRARGRTVAIVAVDPTSRATGGAILGDRIRMQRHHADPGVFIRSMATRGATGGLAQATSKLARLFRGAGFDFVVVETVGVGQAEIEIASQSDVTLVVAVPGMGDDIQAIKAGVMEIAAAFAINKSDHPGANETQREIEAMLSLTGRDAPIFRTVATDGTGVPQLVDWLQDLQRAPRPALSGGRYAIDHLGIAVESLDDALPFYASLGLEPVSRETVEHERVTVAMLPAGESRIELLEPLDADSTIAKFLLKRGPGLHHVALRVPDLNAAAARLAASGARLLSKPRQGAGGHWYVFVHPASAGGVLWELIQE